MDPNGRGALTFRKMKHEIQALADEDDLPTIFSGAESASLILHEDKKDSMVNLICFKCNLDKFRAGLSLCIPRRLIAQND